MTPLTLAHVDPLRLSALLAPLDPAAVAARLTPCAVSEVLRHWNLAGGAGFEASLPVLDAWLALVAHAAESHADEAMEQGSAALVLGLALGSSLVESAGSDVVGSARGFRRALRRIARMQDDDDALQSALDPTLRTATLRAAERFVRAAPTLRRVVVQVQAAVDSSDTTRALFLIGLVGAGVALPERRVRTLQRV